MEKTLATVNINMGLGKDNPVLLITRNTNVASLVSQFIQSYQLPVSAYEVIMEAIKKQLFKQKIDIESLGRKSFDNCQRRSDLHPKLVKKETIERNEVKNKKQSVTWDQIKEKKIQPINRIELPKKGNSPICQQFTKQQMKPKQKNNKICLIRTKSPVLKRDKSGNQSKRTLSPVLNRTPLRQRQITPDQEQRKNNESIMEMESLSTIFDWLTRNQPKTIKVLNPQYVSFTGMRPEALVILQNFFQVVEQNEFMNMDKMYFIRRLKQLNLSKKLIQGFQ